MHWKFTTTLASLFLIPTTALGATEFLVDADGAAPGKYALIVDVAADGTVAVRRVTTVVTLSNGPVIPDGPLSPTVQELKAAADAVVGDSDRELTAATLGTVFGFVKDNLEDGTLPADQTRRFLELALRAVVDKESVASQWEPFIQKVLVLFDDATDKGAFLNECQQALQLSSGGLQPLGDGQLIRLLANLLRSEEFQDVLLPLLLKLLGGL